MRIYILFYILLALPLKAQTLEALVCEDKVFTLLEHWLSKGEWSPEEKGDFILHQRTPTETVGTWITMKADKSRTILILSRPLTSIQVTFDKAKCDEKVEIFQHKNASQNNSFDDEDLLKILTQSKKNKTTGLFYFWSPRMNYSLKGLKEANDLCQKKGWDFNPLVDPDVGLSLVTKTIQKYHLNIEAMPFTAHEFYQRHANYHFPGYLLYKDGEFKAQLRQGYDGPEALKKILEDYANK